MMGFPIGVMHTLGEAGALDFDKGTTLATASGGAIVGACYASGVPAERILECIIKANADNRQRGVRGWGMQLDKVISGFLEDLLPEDAHLITKGRLIIPTRVIRPREQAGPQFHSTFSSKDDLLNVVIGSSYIPYYTGGGIGHLHNGVYHTDGATTKVGECDSFVPVTVRDSYAYGVNGNAIRYNGPILKVIQNMAFPQNPEAVRETYHNGVEAANRWLEVHSNCVEVRNP